MGHVLGLDRKVSFGRWRSDGSQCARQHSRPEERPASHHAPGHHRGLRQALDLGPLGRRPVGAQPARCRPRDHHRAPPERRGNCDRVGPDTASRVLSRHPWSARPRHTVRGLVRPHLRSGRSRRSFGGRRGSTCFRTPLASMKSAVEAGDQASRADSSGSRTSTSSMQI